MANTGIVVIKQYGSARTQTLHLDLSHDHSQSTHSAAKYTLNNYLLTSFYTKLWIGQKLLV